MDHEYVQIRFPTKEGLRRFIDFLEDVEKLWEKTEGTQPGGTEAEKGN